MRPFRYAIPSVLFFICLLCSTARAEPISPEEARTLLRHARFSSFELGSYRRYNSTTTKTGTRTMTVLTRRDAGKPLQSRTEIITTVNGHPEQTRTTLTIVNAEGIWQLYGRKAVLMPQLMETAKVIEQVVRAAVEEPSAQADLRARADAEDNKVLKQGLALASHIHISGERTTDADRAVLRLTATYDADVRAFFRQTIQDQIAEIKKQLPLTKRILLSAFLAVKGNSIGEMPAREVFVVDAQTRKTLSSETYDADGKLKSKRRPDPEPERIADLPAETFALPTDVEVIRPKNIVEAMELGQKLEAEQKKMGAAQG